MTDEDLAARTSGVLDHHFETIKGHIDQHHAEIRQVLAQGFDRMNRSFDRIDRKFDEIDSIMDRIEENIDAIRKELR